MERKNIKLLKSFIKGMSPFSSRFQNLPYLFSKKFGPGSIDFGNVGIYIPQINSPKIPKPLSRRRIIIKSLKVSYILGEYNFLYNPITIIILENFFPPDDSDANIRNYAVFEYRIHLHV